MLSVNDLPFVAAIACGAARLNCRKFRLLPRKDRVAMRPSTQNRIIHRGHITPSVRRCEELASGRPGRRNRLPHLPCWQWFADWVGQAVSPAGPGQVFTPSQRGDGVAEQIVAAPKPESQANV